MTMQLSEAQNFCAVCSSVRVQRCAYVYQATRKKNKVGHKSFTKGDTTVCQRFQL